MICASQIKAQHQNEMDELELKLKLQDEKMKKLKEDNRQVLKQLTKTRMSVVDGSNTVSFYSGKKYHN